MYNKRQMKQLYPVAAKNGKSIYLEVPPAGFVILAKKQEFWSINWLLKFIFSLFLQQITWLLLSKTFQVFETWKV
jgi:hypothetical protein